MRENRNVEMLEGKGNEWDIKTGIEEQEEVKRKENQNSMDLMFIELYT